MVGFPISSIDTHDFAPGKLDACHNFFLKTALDWCTTALDSKLSHLGGDIVRHPERDGSWRPDAAREATQTWFGRDGWRE